MSVHPRVSISGLCFPELDAVRTIEAIAALGGGRTSLTGAKLRAAGAKAVAANARQHGVSVVAATGALGLDLGPGTDIAGQLEQVRADVDNAATVGAMVMYGLTGRRRSADWDADADAYAEAVADVVDYAVGLGVTLAVEPTNWLYADLTFVHTFRDALRLARRARMGVCLDLFHVWTEAELRDDITKNIDAIAHVQLGDLVLGDRVLPCRAVPGEGGVPLESMVRWLVEAGYQGTFDCELNGPRIDAIGASTAAARAAAWLGELLADLGG